MQLSEIKIVKTSNKLIILFIQFYIFLKISKYSNYFYQIQNHFIGVLFVLPTTYKIISLELILLIYLLMPN